MKTELKEINSEYSYKRDEIQILQGKEAFYVSDMIRVLSSMPQHLPIAFVSISDNDRFVQPRETNMAFFFTKNTKGIGDVFVIATIGTK
ncbi:MAG: hypothetical protein BWY78_00539 [Alphaproteobacteria bacterium ADurb.Bin438]|jgi:hypothetical protein|nr:MAG: hypothetical protein BWY78_00539 [Alphaproteobacteria bacterium ADurb.Bin438]